MRREQFDNGIATNCPASRRLTEELPLCAREAAMYHKCPGRVRCVALGTSSPRQQFESNDNRCTLTSISSKKKRKTGQTKSDTNNQQRPKPVAEAGRPTRWCQTSSPLNAQCHRYTMRRGHAEARYQHLDKKKKSIRALNLPTRPPRRQILVKVF